MNRKILIGIVVLLIIMIVLHKYSKPLHHADHTCTSEAHPTRTMYKTTRTTGTTVWMASPTSVLSDPINSNTKYLAFSDDINVPEGFISVTYSDGSVSILPPIDQNYPLTSAITRVVIKGIRVDVTYFDGGVVHTLENQAGQSNVVSNGNIQSIIVYPLDPAQSFVNPDTYVAYSIRNVPDGFFAYATQDGSLYQLPTPTTITDIQSDSNNPIVHIMSRNLSLDIRARRDGADKVIKMMSGESEFFVDTTKSLNITSLRVYPRIGGDDQNNVIDTTTVSAQITMDSIPEGTLAIVYRDRSLHFATGSTAQLFSSTNDNPIICVLTKYVAMDLTCTMRGVRTVLHCTSNDSSSFSVTSDFSIESVYVT